MDLANFINNLRAGIAEADKQAINFMNQAGNDIGRAWNIGIAPIQALGNQIGQTFNQLGNQIGKDFNNFTNGIAQSFQPTQQVQQAQPAQQVQPTSTNMPAVNTQQQQQIDPNMTYYVRDPAIDGFVNTLRFLMNPIRGITGWTPLDIIADTTSDNIYGTFGKRYVPASNDTNNSNNQPGTTDTTETTKPAEEAKLTSADDSDVVTYTYKPGDTFGQVILDLGLGTANGLWGANGDVDYYTKQLIDQGIWSDRIPHNIPIGTTIKLRRRK